VQFDGSPRQDALVIREHQRLVCADDDHEIIPARQVMLHQPKRFAEHPPDAVAAWRGADLA
jgi:hypothetical protein